MRKIGLLLITLFISTLAYSQVSIAKVLKLVEITTATRDGLSIAVNEFPVIYNGTTNRFERYNGATWEEWVDPEANDLSSVVTWANVPDANITQSSVTQHQAALTLPATQIDFTPYSTIAATDVQGAIQEVLDEATAGVSFGDINTSAKIAAIVGDETGTGSLVFSTSPVLVTPNLGTPSAAVLTNATGLPVGQVTQHEAAITITESQISDNTPPDNLGADADRGDFTVATGNATIDTGAITTGKILDGTIKEEDLDVANAPTDEFVLTYEAIGDVLIWEDRGTSPTSIVGISGTKAEYDTSLTDGDFKYVGDAPTSHNHVEVDITDLQSYLLAASNETITGDWDFQGTNNKITGNFNYWGDVTNNASAAAFATNAGIYRASVGYTEAVGVLGPGAYIDNNNSNRLLLKNDNTLSYTVAGVEQFGVSSGGNIAVSGTVDGVDIATDVITKTGTPIDNQVLVATAATVAEGTSGLTYDASTLGVTGDILLSGEIGIQGATSGQANIIVPAIAGTPDITLPTTDLDLADVLLSDVTGEPSGSDKIDNVVSLTQAEYDAGSPVAGTTYIITDGKETFRETIPITAEGADIAVADGVTSWFTPVAVTLTGVYAALKTAPTGSGATFDIEEDDGTPATILSTLLTIDATERSSLTATAAVISDSAIAAGSFLEFNIDVIGSTIAGATGFIVIEYTID